MSITDPTTYTDKRVTELSGEITTWITEQRLAGITTVTASTIIAEFDDGVDTAAVIQAIFEIKAAAASIVY